jgi:DNA recombination protein RmuC
MISDFLTQSPEVALSILVIAVVIGFVGCISLGVRLRHKGLEAASLKAELDTMRAELANLEGQNTRLSEQIDESNRGLADVEAKWQVAVEEKHQSEQTKRVLETQLVERQKSFDIQVAQFDEQKQALKKEFELLANRVFDEKGKAFEESSRSQIDAVLKPFRSQIEGFQKRVNEVHSESLKGSTQLEAQIKHVLDIGLKMSDEAKNLSQALKGDKKAQGNWGEIQVQQLLEMAGLQEGREYQREASFKADDGRHQRPDFIINLPNDKHIIVDSKISLNSYVQSVAADSEDERALHMRAHVEALRTHVKSLAEKNYPSLKGINSPEYVFMFVGNEPAYLAAAEYDATLFQDAYRKGIAIVTPNTLLSSLRIVAHLWSIDKQNGNTRELAEQASKVYDKLRIFVGKMKKLGDQLGTAQKTYDDSWNSLTKGRGNLSSQVDKFVEMGVTVKERLPTTTDSSDGIEFIDSE